MDLQDYPGSRWWKFDFHSHTPKSSDYDPREINSLQPRDWLLAHMRAGIDCVAVTDHNDSGWIEELRTALEALNTADPKPEEYRRLTLFPGAEITTNDEVHILALFGPQTSKADLDGLLRGKLHLVDPNRKNAERIFQESASTVIDAIHSKGGLAIAAHADTVKGLLFGALDADGRFQPKLGVRTVDEVLAKLDGVEGQESGSAACIHFQQRFEGRALVSGSDSPHNTANTGRRFTWVKMSAPDFEGLKLALLDPESAIRRSGDQAAMEPQPLPKQWIHSVTLENLHLRRPSVGALQVTFNPAYNAIIGGRGSGKSTVLEGLRLSLGRDNELLQLDADSELRKAFENFRQQYTRRDKPGMMLPDSRISALVVKGQGDHATVFEYVWSRRQDGASGVCVRRWEQEGWHETGLNVEQARAAFPVKIFSQKQVLALANTPQALLGYIDDSIRAKKKEWQEEFNAKKAALLAARRKVRALKAELAQKPALELEHKEACRKAQAFADSNFGPLLKAFQRATQQQRAMEDFHHLMIHDVQSLREAVSQAAHLPETELIGFDPQNPAEQAAVEDALTVRYQLVGQYQTIVQAVSTMEQLLTQAAAKRRESEWHREASGHLDRYRQEMERLQAAGIHSAQEAAASVAAVERLAKQLKLLQGFEAQLALATQEVKTATDELCLCREQLTKHRAAFIQQLFQRNDMLKVELRSMADGRGAVESLRGILRLSDNAQFKDVWSEDENGNPNGGFLWAATAPERTEATGARLHLMRLDLEAGSKEVLDTMLHGKLQNRIKELPPEAFDELAGWFPEDEVRLEYRPGEGEGYKGIQQASAGQKTAAILSFLLAHGEEPLILDQPEDDLDNALVSQLVVNQLRKNKTQRQLIIVTHNANIVVNGDAELVLSMNFAGGQINLASCGGLQEGEVRKGICRIMEGGEKAFRQRYKRILKDLEGRP